MRTKSQAFGLWIALILWVVVGLTTTAFAQPAFQVKDISTSPTSAGFGDSAVWKGSLYFGLADGIHGAELWRTDGSRAGTRLVKDLCPGICSSDLSQITVFRDRLYFGAFDGEHRLLFVSDGTPEGTVPVLDSGSPAATHNLIPIGE